MAGGWRGRERECMVVKERDQRREGGTATGSSTRTHALTYTRTRIYGRTRTRTCASAKFSKQARRFGHKERHPPTHAHKVTDA
jgi:hypothetical protein